MIISGGSRGNWRFFAKHLTNTRDNESVNIVEYRGVDSRSVLDAFREMDAIASGTRCKNFFYHADLNPRETERLTPEQWDKAVDMVEARLGLEGQPRFVVQHEKEGRVHQHVIWSRIDADSMTAISDSLTYKKHEAAAREIEQEFNLQPVESVLVEGRETPRPERRPKNWETFRGNKSGIDPETVKADVTELWNESDSGKAFAAALTEHGYMLCKGDKRDYCIIDPAGKEHSLARRVEGAKAADIRERMRDVDRDSLPCVADARALNREGQTPEVQEKREDRAYDRFMQPVIEAVQERGETPLHGMSSGGEWWERVQVTWQGAREKVSQAWESAKTRWQEFMQDENSGRERTPQR